ncbi:MAG: hypothetical protein D6760_02175 [Deltaproteobacteria bacterium]|nr:MAG: hypothetical protein D6760_02175 [Deltaproteobacteria bacterium]
MDHDALEELGALVAIGAADEAERRQWLDHLESGCPSCRLRHEQGQAVAEALARVLPAASPRPATGVRLKQRVREGAVAAQEALVEAIVPRPPSSEISARIKAEVRRSLESCRTAGRASLIGRDSELAELGRWLDRTRNGEGVFVCVEGDAGVGKSRLIAEALECARQRGLEVWNGRAAAVEGTEAFGPIVDLISTWAGIDEDCDRHERRRRLETAARRQLGAAADEALPFLSCLMRVADEVPAAGSFVGLEAQALERGIRRAMQAILEARLSRGAAALVLDDVHWADSSSLSAVASLLSMVERRPLAVVVSVRSGENARADRFIEDARRALGLRFHHLQLHGLDERDALVLARRLAGSDPLPAEVDRLVRERADGNPFFIEEIARAAASSAASVETIAGGDVARLILSRAERLPQTARAVLDAAAVAGRRVHRRVLESMIGGGAALDEALELLERRHFLERRASRETSARRVLSLQPEPVYDFRHALVQTVLLEAIPPRRRRELHAACARAVEEAFPQRRRDFHGLLAYQYVHAGELGRAREHLMAAGEIAAGSAASAEALEFFEQAAALYRASAGAGKDRDFELRLHRNLGLALLGAGRLGESIEHFDAALRLLGEHKPKSSLGMALAACRHLFSIVVSLYSGQLGRTQEPASGEERLRFELMYNRCRAQNIVDDERRAFDNLAAIRHVGRLDCASVENATGILAAAGAFFAFAGYSFDPSHRFLKIARRLAEQGTDRDRFLYGTMAFVVRYLEGDWSRQHDLPADLVERGIRMGLFWDADVYLGMVAERAVLQGDYAEARRVLEQISRLRRDWGYEFSRSNELAIEAYLRLAQRRVDGARVAAERWYDLRSEAPMRLLALAVQARIEVVAGNLAAAEQLLDRARPLLRGRIYPYYAGMYYTARLALDLAYVDRAALRGSVPAHLLRRAKRSRRKALANSRRVARDRAETLRLAATLDWRLGRWEEAVKGWQRAAEECRRLGVVAELARVLAEQGEAIAGAGPAAAAAVGVDPRACLEQAAALFERIGNEVELARVRTVVERRLRAA